MADHTDWDQLRAERRALVQRFSALTTDQACAELRAAMEASPSLYSDRYVNTVYEGPTRSFLLPLAYELLQTFVKTHGKQAADWLFEHTSDANPLVAAYCLNMLDDLEDTRLAQAADKVAGRTELIHTICGSFGWEGTLAEYGQKLVEDAIGD